MTGVECAAAYQLRGVVARRDRAAAVSDEHVVSDHVLQAHGQAAQREVGERVLVEDELCVEAANEVERAAGEQRAVREGCRYPRPDTQ